MRLFKYQKNAPPASQLTVAGMIRDRSCPDVASRNERAVMASSH
jgi:hypothetical protein